MVVHTLYIYWQLLFEKFCEESMHNYVVVNPMLKLVNLKLMRMDFFTFG